MMMLPFLLIMKEPDLGSALVLLPTGLAMLYAAGTPKRYLALLFAVVGVCAVLFLADILFAPPRWQIKMQDYQRKRLLVYFGRNYTDLAAPGASNEDRRKLKHDQNEDEYNVTQALIAVGSGGLTGKGWLQESTGPSSAQGHGDSARPPQSSGCPAKLLRRPGQYKAQA